MHLETAVARPLFVKMIEPHAGKLNGHDAVIQIKFIAENFTFSTHPRQNLDQPVFEIHFLSKSYERGIRLPADATTVNSAASTPVISTFGSSRDSCVTKLDETVSDLQLNSVGPHLAK